MRRRYPRWTSKLGTYVCALSNGDRATLAAVRANRPLRRGATRFLWIGRWAAHKGTQRLLRFLAERLAGSGDETFTLAGCGGSAERDLPADWLRSGRVRLVPSFARSELPPLLAEHDAGLFTSEVEGWGLSLNEMLESGLTVFATEAGGVSDLDPYFPTSLRPFPPPIDFAPQRAPEDLAANGYLARFSWDAVAAEYERQVLAC
jgi:glycosyltransferase involved in cell wall biosynthesis